MIRLQMLGDRLAAGRRVLAPLTQVRILVPQPFRREKGTLKSNVALFLLKAFGQDEIFHNLCTRRNGLEPACGDLVESIERPVRRSINFNPLLYIGLE